MKYWLSLMKAGYFIIIYEQNNVEYQTYVLYDY